MKADFSRLSRRSSARFTSVLMQQGRLHIDSDWNALAQILEGGIESLAADLIGANGAPATDPGFELIPRGGISFAQGRCVEVSEVTISEAQDFTLEVLVQPEQPGGTLVTTPASDCELRVDWDDAAAGSDIEVTFTVGSASCSAPLPRTGAFVHVAGVSTSTGITLYLDGWPAASASRVVAISPAASSASSPIPIVSGAGALIATPVPTATVGAPVQSAAGGSPVSASTTAGGLLFGARSGMLDGLQGTLAGVQLWSVARTDAQIYESRQKWLRVDADKTLVAHWPMTDGSGTQVSDVVGGHHGVIAGSASSSPWDVTHLCAMPGRYYVGGLVCELTCAVPLEEQQEPTSLTPGASGASLLAYLEASRQLVTWLEDPSLREVALGGPDTATRVCVGWKIGLFAGALADWQSATKASPPSLRLSADRTPGVLETLGNDLYRVEINSPGAAYGSVFQADAAVTAVSGASVTLGAGDLRFATGQLVEIMAPGNVGITPTSALAIVTQVQALGSGSDSVTTLTVSPPPSTLLAQQTQVSIRRIASFKWSRCNGSEAFQVGSAPAGSNVLPLLESTATMGDALSVNDWVEYVVPGAFSASASSLLYRVTAVGRDPWTVTLDGFQSPAVACVVSDPPAFLRRWESSYKLPNDVAVGVIPVVIGTSLGLERGIFIRFNDQGGAVPAVGDYWVIPARQLTATVDWPRPNGLPLALPPEGPERVVAPLATITLDGSGAPTTTDLRRTIRVTSTEEVPASIAGKRAAPVKTPAVSPPTPAASVWTEVAKGRAGGPAVAMLQPNGTILVVTGGLWAIFDPASRTWGADGTLPMSRTGFGAAVLDGQLQVIGGRDDESRPSAEVSVFDPPSGQWRSGAALPEARYGHAVVALGGKLYVIGGGVAGAPASADLLVYDSQLKRWSKAAPMSAARVYAGATALGAQFVVVGGAGTDGRKLATAESFDPRTGTWRSLGSLRAGRASLTAAALGNRVYAIGGSPDLAPVADVEVLDPSSGSWADGPALPSARTLVGAVGVGDGALYVFGDGAEPTSPEAVLALLLGRANDNVAPGAGTTNVPVAPTTTTTSGIDVSDNNGSVDWTAVAKSGVRFAFAKATDGRSVVDPKFAVNWAAMKAAGIARGAYHFFEPTVDGATQAAHFLATVALEDGDLPAVLDLEVETTSKELITQVQAWLDAVEQQTGCPPIIYVSPAYWDEHMNDQFGRYPLWVAHYGVSSPMIPKGWTEWTFWQYTGSGSSTGVTGNVDLSKCLQLSSVRRIGGAKPPPATTPTTPVTQGGAIPPRPAGAKSGSQFTTEVESLSQPDRDARVLSEITSGNIPDSLRTFVEVTAKATIGGTEHTVVYRVMPDYLTVGSDEDHIRMPMTPLTAQAIGDAFQCMLPTPRMVDQIYGAAPVKLAPYPYNPDQHDDQSVEVFSLSSQHIDGQLADAKAPAGALVGGIRKDVVITTEIPANPGKVAIYGWQELDGTPIQPLTMVHDITYMDYSHGLRMVQQAITVDGKPTTLTKLLQDPVLCALVSGEGVVANPRYGGFGAPPAVPVSPPTGGTTAGVGSVVTLPAGCRGFDRSAMIAAQATQLAADGYTFAVRYVGLAGSHESGALTAEEATEIHAAGLALGLYQAFRETGITVDQGTTDGAFLASQAQAIGFPTNRGMVLWCDLEGKFTGPDGAPVTAATMTGYLESWASAVSRAGYVAGLYNGPQGLLTSADLSGLEGFAAFWKSGTDVPSVTRGYQMQQLAPGNKMVAGINVDEDVVQADGQGRLPTFWKR